MARDRERLQPGCVYIGSPDDLITFADGEIRAIPQSSSAVSSAGCSPATRHRGRIRRPAARPGRGPEPVPGLFQDAGPILGTPTQDGERLVSDEHIQRLEAELRVTKERLKTTIEELEASKEELQSVNEELQTVNGELAHRVGEPARTKRRSPPNHHSA